VVARGLAASIQQARSLIMSGVVIVDDHRIDKPGTPVPLQSRIRLKSAALSYVSRGGTKLERPIAFFDIPVAGKTVVDVGASTGGFTDCLLQRGAARVYAVDVGYGQLAWKLQKDVRVVVMDRTNVRDLEPEQLVPLPDIAVIDASFISLKRLLPHVVSLLRPDGRLLCLVKPQFEAVRDAVEKGGLVRNPAEYQKVMSGVVRTARDLSLHVAGIVESPIQGHKGNREFFIYLLRAHAG